MNDDKTSLITEVAFSKTKSKIHLGRIAIVWRGDTSARSSAALQTSRFKDVFAALGNVGVDAGPVIYEDDVLEAVRAQLAWRARLGQPDSRRTQPRQS